MHTVSSDFGWAMLAAAILQSGKRADDKSFLESDWHDVLYDIVSCFLDMKNFKESSSMFTSKNNVHKQK
jgi:hypothetical protein